MARNQRAGLNSAPVLTALAGGAVSDQVPLPEGVILRDEQEMVIWQQFTRARARNDWRDFDLLLLAKAVRTEADIRRHQQMLDRTGPIVKNPKGTPIMNPLFTIIDSLQRQQLAIIRSLSLSQTVTDPRTKNAVGYAQGMLRSVMADTDDLIAKPQ